MSLQATEKECAANAIAPRVAIADIEAAIASRYVLTAAEMIRPSFDDYEDCLSILTVCILVMKNGFTVVGKSAPASPENFKAELGAKLAYEDCIRQLWPLLGYCLREKLSTQEAM